MIDAMLTAVILGFLAGAVPGPYTTVVASTAVERGFRPAVRLALVPLFTDIPPMLASVFLLRRLNADILTAIGVVGGAVLVGLGVRFFRQRNEGAERPGEGHDHRTFWATVSAGILSPAPWIFWLVAAGPLLLQAWRRSWIQGVAYGAILFACLMGTAAGIAWLAAHGRGYLSGRWRRRVVGTLGVVLIVVGGVLVWQSIEGNFHSMVQRQEELREQVD